MPVLTKDQVIEAAFELLPEEREEVLKRIIENGDNFHLTEEQKEIVRAEIRAYDANPADVVSWEDLKAELQAQVIR